MMFKTVSEKVYRNIFCKDYNPSAFKPEKDQCKFCEKWKGTTAEERTKNLNEEEKHENNKNEAQELKKKLKKNVKMIPHDDLFRSICSLFCSYRVVKNHSCFTKGS